MVFTIFFSIGFREPSLSPASADNWVVHEPNREFLTLPRDKLSKSLPIDTVSWFIPPHKVIGVWRGVLRLYS